MTRTNKALQVMVFSFVCLLARTNLIRAASEEGMDHAPLNKRHIQVREEFLREFLLEGGNYTEKKVAAFLKRLEDERDKVKSQVYETNLLEALELDVKKYVKAKDKAERNVRSSELLFGYNDYLIPKINELLEAVKNNKSKAECDALVSEFIWGYIPYFIPNPHRTVWIFDTDILFFVKKLFKDFSFKKDDPKKVEANNLRALNEDLPLINSCLGMQFDSKHYFTHSEIEKLKGCNFDIAKLNPGVSAIWEPVEMNKVFESIKESSPYLPGPSDELHYRRVSFRGNATPKINVEFVRGGKNHILKVKMGQEIHPQVFLSKIFSMLGYNQNIIEHRDKVKVYLGDTTYEEFASQFSNKYGLQSLTRFITSHGKDAKGEWIFIRDVAVDARPANILRVTPLDFSSWDLSNRREVRAYLLLWAWINVNDARLGNFKLLFYRDLETQKLTPKLRFHDLGQALGSATKLKEPNDALSIFKFYRVNSFESSFLSTNKKKNRLKVEWNDFFARRRTFTETTWNDLKWMARLISPITREQLYELGIWAGMPEPVADLYAIKLMMRRNEMVKAFSLDEEFPIVELPDLKKYSPNEEIKKGKVIKMGFSEKNNIVRVEDRWETVIPSLMMFDLPTKDWTDTSSGIGVKGGLQHLEGLKGELGLMNAPTHSGITQIPLGIGAQATLTRIVRPNGQLMMSDGLLHAYKVVDKVTLKFGLDSDILDYVMRHLPVLKGTFKLNFFSKEFEYIHYADNTKDAYFSPFKLHKIIADMEKYAAFELKPLELLRHYDEYGFEMEVGVGAYSIKPAFNNEISATVVAKKILSRYYVRDGYGQMHFFDDKLHKQIAGINLDIATFDFLVARLPFFAWSKGKSHFVGQTTDFILRHQDVDRDNPDSPYEPEQVYEILKKVRKNPSSYKDFPELEINFSIDSEGKNSTHNFGALFAFNIEKTKSKADTKVQLADGAIRYFTRYGVIRNRSLGVDLRVAPYVNGLDVSMAKRKRVKNIIEMDRDDPSKFVFAIRTEDYYRIKDAKDIPGLFNDLNRRYSVSEVTPFYPRDKFLQESHKKKYVKVYALTRVLLNGALLSKKLKQTPYEELRTMVEEHFHGKDSKHKNFNNKIRKVKVILKNIKEHLATPKKEWEFSKLLVCYEKLVSRLETEVFGLSFLKSLLDKEGMYVMGEVTGVLKNISALQDLQQLQRRRYTGISWGTYAFVPPLQKFLRKNRLLAPSFNLKKNLSDQAIFGYLETATAPDLEIIYDQNKGF